MGVIRSGKTAARKYYRSLDRLLEQDPHMVHVIQDKRALRDEARLHGIEFMVGDTPECWCDHAKDGHDGGKGACSVEECKCKGYRVPKIRKSQSLIVSLEGFEDKTETVSLNKAEKGEDVYPHKYVEKYTTPSGNIVYIYADDLKHSNVPKETGFEGKEKKGPQDELGKKRARVTDEVKDAHPEIQAKTLEGLAGRESTQRAMQLATKFYGGPEKFEAQFEKVLASNPHLDAKENRHHMIEAFAKSTILAHPEIDVAEPYTGSDASTGKYKNVAGGQMHPDVRQRQPWQLTGDQYKERQGIDPAIGDVSHEDVIRDAHERGEFIPAKVLEEHSEVKEDYLDSRGDLDLSPETEKYIEKFDKLTKGLPTTFESWVKPDLKSLGDDLLTSEKTSGYNIDSFDVSERGIYSHMMTADENVVLYHMYAQNAGHGREMLAIMHENGLDPQYTVVKRASAVYWDDGWGEPSKEMTTRSVSVTKDGKKQDRRIAYSSDYVLAFKPDSKEQAEAIYAVLAKHGNMNSDHAIPHAYYVPDTRSSQKVDAFEKSYLNIFQKGSQELTVLTKNDWIRSDDKPAVSREEARKPEARDYKKGMLRENVWIERKQTKKEQKENAPPFLAQVIKSHRNEFGEVLLVRLEK